jgi:hypothetical protein
MRNQERCTEERLSRNITIGNTNSLTPGTHVSDEVMQARRLLASIACSSVIASRHLHWEAKQQGYSVILLAIAANFPKGFRLRALTKVNDIRDESSLFLSSII